MFEIIRIIPQIAAMIQAGETVENMQQAAVDDGMKLLHHSAIEKVLSGDTGLDEALSICVH